MQNNEFSRETTFKAERFACCFHWSPVFAGALVGLGLGFLLHLFGTSIGLSAYTTNPDGATTLAVGGLLGLMIGAFASMFVAGFTSGFFAGFSHSGKNYGVAYGFIAWSLSIFLAAILMSNIGSFMASYSYMTGHPAKNAVSVNEVTATAETVTTRLHPATDATDTKTEKNVRAVGLAALAGFIVFFVGAFAAALGGYYGVQCRRKECCDKTRNSPDVRI